MVGENSAQLGGLSTGPSFFFPAGPAASPHERTERHHAAAACRLCQPAVFNLFCSFLRSNRQLQARTPFSNEHGPPRPPPLAAGCRQLDSMYYACCTLNFVHSGLEPHCNLKVQHRPLLHLHACVLRPTGTEKRNKGRCNACTRIRPQKKRCLCNVTNLPL